MLQTNTDPNILQLIEIARAEVGYMEKKNANNLDDKNANAGQNNYTKYARDLYPGLQGQPWCDIFVDWCFVKTFGKAQTLKLTGPFSAYTPTSAQWFKDKGQWHSRPKVGDLIFFKNSVRICHIGLVYKVAGNVVYTIEGNTSLGSQVIPNGGSVCYKQYDVDNSRIAGYGRPDYSLLKSKSRYEVGWNRDDRGWWYADTGNSYIKSSWKTINNHWYYFGEDGYAVTGLQVIDGKKYIFDNTINGEFECCMLKTDENGALSVATA